MLPKLLPSIDFIESGIIKLDTLANENAPGPIARTDLPKVNISIWLFVEKVPAPITVTAAVAFSSPI